MITRRLDNTDLPEILRVYNSQDNILKIKKTIHIDLHYKKSFRLYVNGDPTMGAYGVFDDNKLIAFSTYNIWTTLPYWTMGLFYIDTSYIATVHNIGIAETLKSALVEYAESNRVYTAFSIATINAAGMRAWQHSNLRDSDTITPLWAGNQLRYDITIEEIIPPFAQSKYRTFSQMLGITEGCNSVPLVVTKWSLLNKYRTLSISEKHIKRLNKLSNV